MSTSREIEPQMASDSQDGRERLDQIAEAPESPADRSKTAHFVLLGCAVQQIPVWGFQLAFGVIQQYEVSNGTIEGSESSLGIVGTTLTGVIYMSMPFISAFLTRYQGLSRTCSIIGALLATLSLVIASFATKVWHLICALSILHGFGAALLYTSTMLILNTWFVERKGLAFAVTLSTKAAIGAATPLLFSALLDRVHYQYTTLIWAGVALLSSIPPALFLQPRTTTQSRSLGSTVPRRVPWSLLKCRTAWGFIFATTVFSAGYGLPQTYLPTYATQVLKLSGTLSSSLLALQAAISVPASLAFGVLGDGSFRLRGRRINVHAATGIAGLGSAVAAFLLWGFSANAAILILFSLMYGFFAGGYSAIWSGVMKEVARERQLGNDDSDTGLVFGLLNGGRGVGFAVGGLIGAQLLKAGPVGSPQGPTYGYGSMYAAMILFTGITSIFGGSSLLWKAVSFLNRS